MNNATWLLSTARGVAAGLLLVVPLTLVVQNLTSNSPLPSSAPTGQVHSVIDGDTLVLSIAGQQERVRLLGIDTPESVSPNAPKQCFGDEATQALKGLVAPGDTVKIEADIERRDRFGRLLLYVHTDTGLAINQWLVQSGFAEIMFFEPNTSMRAEFTAARNQARSAGIGLWSQCEGPDQPLS